MLIKFAPVGHCKGKSISLNQYMEGVQSRLAESSVIIIIMIIITDKSEAAL